MSRVPSQLVGCFFIPDTAYKMAALAMCRQWQPFNGVLLTLEEIKVEPVFPVIHFMYGAKSPNRIRITCCFHYSYNIEAPASSCTTLCFFNYS